MVSDEDRPGWHVTFDRDLAEALVEHYADHPEVESVPDAFRQAARDVLSEGDK